MGQVVLSTQFAGLKPFIRGKVRDVYDLGSQLLIVATDRISAFDVVLPTGIPDKGKVLNQLSAFWFEQVDDRCPNHFVTTDARQIQAALERTGTAAREAEIAGRSMLVKKTKA